MDLLIVNQTQPLFDQLQNFLLDATNSVLTADSLPQVSNLLITQHIQTVSLQVERLEDIAILRYINIHHPGVRVMLIAREETRELISAIQTGHYSFLDKDKRRDSWTDVLHG